MKAFDSLRFICLMLCVTSGYSASAISPWKATFKEMFVDQGPESLQVAFADKVIGSCKVCHINGEEKTVRNPFGIELDKRIEGNASERIKAAAEKGSEAKAAMQTQVNEEFLVALKEVLQLPAQAGDGSYGDRIQEGKLPFVPGEESPVSNFSRTTIDLGVVVADIEKTAKFYKQAIGLKELEGFDVNAQFSTDAGLTDNQSLSIRVFALGEDESATKLKLMQVPGAKSAPSLNSSIHSQLGFSYITIFVDDMKVSLERLKQMGVKPLAKGPVPLPKGFPEGVFLTVVKDPDGNFVELVGPSGQ